VLAEADAELRYIEIYEAVQTLLEGSVARSSVKNALASERTRKHPRFERVGHGRYRIVEARAESHP
jgi:predicted transcriptional regulator of viral defense system